jgi:3-oxoadipate enol-lactonase
MPGFASMVCRVVLSGCLCRSGSAWSQSTKASGSGSFLLIEGSPIYFEECGTSPQTVVLLHDGVLHSAVWDEVLPEFCRHFHTIRYDRRGYGRSPAAGSWYFETDDLAALLRHLKVSRAVIVGSSHGG